jgi:3-oxoacyl-(acyl-carrier-protein) synthase
VQSRTIPEEKLSPVCACLYAFERGRLPGTFGLADVRPEGASVLKDARPAKIEAAMVASFSQGGSNAAVVLAAG